MIRQTIEMLFEERECSEMDMLDGLFEALKSLVQGFQIPPEEIAQIVIETQERKQMGSGVIAARLMALLRRLREEDSFPPVINQPVARYR